MAGFGLPMWLCICIAMRPPAEVCIEGFKMLHEMNGRCEKFEKCFSPTSEEV